eukprot:gene15102-20433_t
MVRLFPVKSMISVNRSEICNSPSDGQLSDGLRDTIIPNRFNGKSYDRSVFGVDECIKNLKGDGSDSCCCYMCSHAPLVIVSSGEAICDQYSIRLRNVREFIDG